MKLTAAISLFMATAASAANPFRPASKRNAKSAYMNKLVKGAKATRKLEEQEIDLTSYSLKFEQCQFVKTYDDELADNEESATVLATQRFVIFRLCPEGYCSSCNYNYGEYVIDLETYLESTVQYQQELQEEMCDTCEEYCVNDQDEGDEEQQDEQEDGDERRRLVSVDCDTCYEECQKIENMEENGYVDATNFLECQMIYDPEDDGRDALYAGPICASYGTKIKIGVFTDEECMSVDASKDVEDYLKDEDGYQMKLSHALLKTIYAEDSCVSCVQVEEEDENDNNNGEQQQPETNEMCLALYQDAAKCEDAHGFEGAFYQYNNNNNNNGQNGENWYNQEAQEELVCDFISSLQSGTYDETGEIIISGGSSVVGGGSKTTGGQKFALTFFILGTVGLAVYSAMLHSKLTKGGKADLSTQGGAMA